MPFNFKNANVGVRENRLGSITGFSGDLETLAHRSQCGSVKNRERCFSQSSSCLSGCALDQLISIRNVAVVYHAPAGCVALAQGEDVKFRQLAERINEKTNSVYVCTDLNENDTVFGAIEALRKATQYTYEKFHPEAIFLSSSCVSGVIGEDVDGLADELADEYDIPIIPIHCEGKIIFKNFFESARPQITELFKEIGAEPQFVYCNSTVEELSHLSEAQAMVCICGTLGTYLGNALEETYGVPYVRTINPNGITGFETWFRAIGKTIGKEAEVERYIERQRAIYLPQIEEVKRELKGLRAVIGMGPGYTYEVSRVLQELGMEVVHGLAWHYDYKYDNGQIPPALEHLLKTSPKGLKLTVADQQNYEVMSVLNYHKPDIYFSRHPGSTVWAIKQGYAALFVADEYMIFGYEGTLNFAKSILDTIKNRSFEKSLAARIKLPYTKWWYEQDTDKFLKPEGAR